MIPARRKPTSQSAGPFHQLRRSPSQVVTASLDDAGGSGLDNRYRATILVVLGIRKNELRASRTAGWELERKEVRTLAVLDLRTVAAGALRNNLGSRQASPGPVQTEPAWLGHTPRTPHQTFDAGRGRSRLRLVCRLCLRPFTTYCPSLGGPDIPPRGPPPLKAVHYIIVRRIDGKRPPSAEIGQAWRAAIAARCPRSCRRSSSPLAA